MARKKRASLFNQFVVALSSNFNEGTKKHSYKKEYGREQDAKIFSYGDYNHTVDIAKSFAKFVRTQYPEIHNAYEITNFHVAAFLNEKSKSCNMKTLATYTSRLNHLARALEKSDPGVKLHGGTSWNMPKPKGYTKQAKIRDVWMTDEDREKLENYLTTKTDSASKRALVIALATGLRVHECVTLTGNGIDEIDRMVRGKGKGGRHYETRIKDEYIDLLARYKERFGDEVIANVKSDSVNRYLHACLKECNIDEKYRENRTGVHSIRKNVAQDYYEELVNGGKTHIQASSIVSRNLSHGKYRVDVDRNYIKSKEK